MKKKGVNAMTTRTPERGAIGGKRWCRMRGSVVAFIVFAWGSSLRAQEMFVYRNEQGRPVYVQGLDAVPPKWRGQAKKVDLSQVSLNESVGADLRKRAEEEVAALERRRAEEKAKEERRRRDEAASGREGRDGQEGRDPDGFVDPSADVRDRMKAVASLASVESGAREGAREPLWRRYPAVTAVGAIVVVLMALTPWVLRYVPQEKWFRVIAYAVPLLVALAGLVQFASNAGSLARLVRGAGASSSARSARSAEGK